MPTSDFAGQRYSTRRRYEPTSDSLALVTAAVRAVRGLWRDGFEYAKAGVKLADIVRAVERPSSLFPSRDPVKSSKLMEAMDAVNARHGRGTVRPAVTGVSGEWTPRQGHLSSRYTTDIEGVMVAKT